MVIFCILRFNAKKFHSLIIKNVYTRGIYKKGNGWIHISMLIIVLDSFLPYNSMIKGKFWDFFNLGDWHTIKLDILGVKFVKWAKMNNKQAFFLQRVPLFEAV